ncbi:MAG TPA: Rrf2 family transcriptional regulator [Bacteroidales bacterium]|nr:Rrf2 family transcriptional regulator [Bacteroidales bacterium]
MLSATCKYGIRAVIFIASRPDPKINTGLRQISEELRIPRPYLAKILQVLSRKKILHSSKGPHGGFYLLIPAAKLTLMDIIEAIDGGDFFDSCYVTGERCNFDQPDNGVCILHNELRKEKDNLAKFFSSKTIGDLVNQVSRNPEVVI